MENSIDVCKLLKELKGEILENRKQIGETNITLAPIVNSLEIIMKELTGIKEDYTKLKKKVIEQQEEIKFLKRQAKENNIVMFRVPEGNDEEKSNTVIKKTMDICTRVGVKIDEGDINKCYRIGSKGTERPILVSFKTYIKKTEIMQQKMKFKELNHPIAADRTKEDRMEIRSAYDLINELKNTGINAYLRRRKIIINNTEHSLEEARNKFSKNLPLEYTKDVNATGRTGNGEGTKRKKTEDSPEEGATRSGTWPKIDLEKFRRTPKLQ
jgi:hypothetical protein